MHKLFNVDGKFMNVLGKIFDCVALSLCWVLACIPIITIGTSCGALYRSICQSVRRDEGYALKKFWDTFGKNLRNGILTWIPVLLVYAFLIADAIILRGLVSQGKSISKLLGIVIVLIGVATVWAAYVTAYSARFEGTIKEVLGLSFYLVVAHPLMSIIMLIVLVTGIALGLIVPFFIIFLPSAVCLVNSILMEHVFMKHMKQEDIDKMLGGHYEKSMKVNEEKK